MHNSVAIIGAGPAGVSAFVQLSRYGIEADIYEKNQIGGLAINANLIENLVPFYNGISGKKYVKLLEKHLMKYAKTIIKEEVINVEYLADKFVLTSTNNSQREYSTLIIASGTKPNLPHISLPKSDRIKFDVAEILDLKSKEIIIIGSGDAAFDYGLNLAKYNNVKILNRNSQIKCLQLLFDRAKNEKNIEYVDNCELIKIEDVNQKLELQTNNASFKTDYLIFAIGRNSNIDFMSEKILIRKNELMKSKKLFLIGDLSNGNYRQISISIGDGMRSAMEIFENSKQK